jgi:endonuclease VIII-like 1
MPELAELRLTADYINQESKGKTFFSIKKNPNHKGEDLFKDIDFPFTINAKSRGKELMIEISTSPEFATEENIKVQHLMMGMGMSGYFKWIDDGSIEKHAHLKFFTEGGCLAFIDVRRFGKWKWGYWSSDRGPDPTTQHESFVGSILSNLSHRDFNKPINEILMNQRWFNGIGNYLRAEILYRADINPFMPARDAIKIAPEILNLCKSIPETAYLLGGGELKDWVNPFKFDTIDDVKIGWKEFMKCYGKPGMSTMIDNNGKGRRFWYNPKWDIGDSNWCHYSGMPSPSAYIKNNKK